MTVNVPLLRKVMEHITEHPEEHDQQQWCGTACCIAGHAALMTGWQMQTFSCGSTSSYLTRDGLRDHAESIAMEELGLGRAEAYELFSGHNTLDDIWSIVDELTDGEIMRPDADGAA